MFFVKGGSESTSTKAEALAFMSAAVNATGGTLKFIE